MLGNAIQLRNTASMAHTPAKQYLYAALLDLRDQQDAEGFLQDMLTSTELDALMNRWNVAVELARPTHAPRKRNQTEIAGLLGVSATTVTNVKEHVFGRHSSGVARRIATEYAKEAT
jgi:uncharacterized protein YerC